MFVWSCVAQEKVCLAIQELIWKDLFIYKVIVVHMFKWKKEEALLYDAQIN